MNINGLVKNIIAVRKSFYGKAMMRVGAKSVGALCVGALCISAFILASSFAINQIQANDKDFKKSDRPPIPDAGPPRIKRPSFSGKCDKNEFLLPLDHELKIKLDISDPCVEVLISGWHCTKDRKKIDADKYVKAAEDAALSVVKQRLGFGNLGKEETKKLYHKYLEKNGKEQVSKMRNRVEYVSKVHEFSPPPGKTEKYTRGVCYTLDEIQQLANYILDKTKEPHDQK